jgi:UDP-N-acetylglucosamine:LPS N-acetylglucosamine transferase
MCCYPFLKTSLTSFFIRLFTFKKISFILFLPLLALSNQISSFESLSELAKTYQIIDDNQLIDHQGNKYSPYLFEDSFHSDLVFKIKDTDLGLKVYKAYNKHLRPLLRNAEDIEIIQNAIKDTCLLFGGQRALSEAPFLRAIRQHTKNETLIDSFSIKAIGLFLDDISNILNHEVHEKHPLPRIVITTTTCSGGNLSIAKALYEELCKRKDIEVIIVDTEDIAKKSDPILRVTGKYTFEAIYSFIFQQTNDFNVIQERKHMRRQLHRFVPSNVLFELKKTVADLKPDLIISTRSYTEEDFCLSTLGCPFCMMNVDFELCDSLNFYYKNAPDSFIQFWIQHSNASMFKPIFDTNGFQKDYLACDTSFDLNKKLEQILEIPLDSIKQKFKVIGYPCSSVFFPIDDEAKLALLRKKWGINEGSTPVFILMGKHGTKATKKIFSKLIEEPLNNKITYLFITGSNAQLKIDLEKRVSRSKKNIKDNFLILGCLSQIEMNEVLNMCPTGISKSGASSTIEFLTLNKSVLLMSSYPWEEVNGLYLIEKGLASHVNPNDLLVNQINNAIKNAYNRNNATENQIWRLNLENEVHAFISCR